MLFSKKAVSIYTILLSRHHLSSTNLTGQLIRLQSWKVSLSLTHRENSLEKRLFRGEDLFCKVLIAMIFLLSAIILASAFSVSNNFDLGYSDCTQGLKNKIVRIDSEGLRQGAGNIILDVFYLRGCGESLCPERMEKIKPWRTMYGDKIRAEEKADVLLVHDLKICCSPTCFTNVEDIYGDCMLYSEERGSSSKCKHFHCLRRYLFVRGVLVRGRGWRG